MKKKEIGMLIGSIALTATMTACGAQNEPVVSDNTEIVSETSMEAPSEEPSTETAESTAEPEVEPSYSLEQVETFEEKDENPFPKTQEHIDNPWLSYYFNYTNKSEATQALISSGCSQADAEALVNALDKFLNYKDCEPDYRCNPQYVAATIDTVLLGKKTAAEQTYEVNELFKMAQDPSYIPDFDRDGKPDWGAPSDTPIIPDPGPSSGTGSGGSGSGSGGGYQVLDPPADSCPANVCAAGFQGIY